MNSQSLEGLIQRAHQAHSEGRVGDASSLCNQALAIQATYVPAKVLKGILANQVGDNDLAISLLEEVLEFEPRAPQALMGLAMSYRDSGRIDKAIQTATRLIQQFPGFAPGHNVLGLCRQVSGELEEAVSSFRRALEIKPDFTMAHYNLGSTLQAMGRRVEAASTFRKLIEINPEAVNAIVGLAQIALNDGELQEAEELTRRAVAKWPRFHTAHLLLGQVLMESGNYEEAESEIRRAIELNPKDHQGPQALAFLLIDRGKLEEAREGVQASLDLQPRQGGAYYYFTQLKKIGEEDQPLVERMESLLEGATLPPLEREYLNFALGKSYDDLGRWGEAIAHYVAGHGIAHARAAGESHYNRENDAREKQRITDILNEEFLRRNRDAGLESGLPIFICGMIRSGTTLMEQIVSSHPEVGAAGEQQFWPRNWWTALDRFSARLDAEKLRQITGDYLRILQEAAPGKSRVTDKMPGNVLILGLIHLALPNAKIIHMQRSPIDTCLSILTTRFTKPPEFAASKADIVSQYRVYQRVVEHWRKVLPKDRFLDVRYEQLIEDPETVTRGIVEFLELPWDDACLRHQENRRSVKTPSVWKVRQPLYKSSVERWRRYEPWLEELAELLPTSGPQ